MFKKAASWLSVVGLLGVFHSRMLESFARQAKTHPVFAAATLDYMFWISLVIAIVGVIGHLVIFKREYPGQD